MDEWRRRRAIYVHNNFSKRYIIKIRKNVWQSFHGETKSLYFAVCGCHILEIKILNLTMNMNMTLEQLNKKNVTGFTSLFISMMWEIKYQNNVSTHNTTQLANMIWKNINYWIFLLINLITFYFLYHFASDKDKK